MTAALFSLLLLVCRCDRILWLSRPGCARDCALASGQAHPKVTTSDHTPVSALFNLVKYELPPCHDPLRGACVLSVAECLLQPTSASLRASLKAPDNQAPYLQFSAAFLPCPVLVRCPGPSRRLSVSDINLAVFNSTARLAHSVLQVVRCV
jgi:hypothetical protein